MGDIVPASLPAPVGHPTWWGLAAGAGLALEVVILVMRVAMRVTSRAAWMTTLWSLAVLAASAVLRDKVQNPG